MSTDERDGRVCRHPRGEQLVGAQAQQREELRIELGERPVDAGLEDGVVGALAAQRAVGQLGGEGRIAPDDAALGEQTGQHEVGVGVLELDPAQQVERRPPRRIDHAPRSAGRAPLRCRDHP